MGASQPQGSAASTSEQAEEGCMRWGVWLRPFVPSRRSEASQPSLGVPRGARGRPAPDVSWMCGAQSMQPKREEGLPDPVVVAARFGACVAPVAKNVPEAPNQDS